jgi:hypothetical protein
VGGCDGVFSGQSTVCLGGWVGGCDGVFSGQSTSGALRCQRAGVNAQQTVFAVNAQQPEKWHLHQIKDIWLLLEKPSECFGHSSHFETLQAAR